MKLIAIFLAYLIGSMPFSFLIAKIFKGIDIRTVGSKNVGTTNVLRTCGKSYALLAFLLDSGKAGLSYYFACYFFDNIFSVILGGIVVISHCYSVFLKFKGGKGVASMAGLVLFLKPIVFFALLALFIGIVILTNYVSLASITVVILSPIFYYSLTYDYIISIILLFLAFFVIYKHKSNIIRLKNGKENKIRFSKK